VSDGSGAAAGPPPPVVVGPPASAGADDDPTDATAGLAPLGGAVKKADQLPLFRKAYAAAFLARHRAVVLNNDVLMEFMDSWDLSAGQILQEDVKMIFARFDGCAFTLLSIILYARGVILSPELDITVVQKTVKTCGQSTSQRERKYKNAMNMGIFDDGNNADCIHPLCNKNRELEVKFTYSSVLGYFVHAL
jgi:hypothetical protein